MHRNTDKDDIEHQSNDGRNEHIEDDDNVEISEDEEKSIDGSEDDEDVEWFGDEESSFNGSENDEFDSFRWLEQIDGRVLLTDPSSQSGQRIGNCDCKLIRRSSITPSFYDDMEEPTEGTSDLAFDVFDRYGRLRKEFKEHAIKRGTGIWQDELDEGDLLLFERLSIDKPYRRRGLGQKLVHALIEKTRPKSENFFAVVCPGYLTREIESDTKGMTDEEREVAKERVMGVARNFWRSLGFRRIGSSSWFAWAGDEHHRCHTLSIQDDYDPPVPPRRTPRPDIDPLLNEVSLVKNPEWHREMMGFFGSLNANDPRWRATDNTGNTVLHLAAIHTKSESVSWIMNRNSQLQTCRNDAGETPLEALEFHLESERTRREFGMKIDHISDEFQGFNDESVMCLSQLKGLQDANRHEMLRMRYGCSCGQCTEGFLSPRMRFTLSGQAGYQYDMLRELGVDDGRHFVELWSGEVKYVPVGARENMNTNKSMRQGFANLCDHFNTCIQKDGILSLPTKENVLLALREASEWPPVSRHFLQRGGTVESVGSMLFETAMNQDRYAGDYELLAEFEDDISKLPECRNDHEFGFVSGMCGYKRVGAFV